MAEVGGACDAVQSAIELQHVLIKQKTATLEDRRITQRTGIRLSGMGVDRENLYDSRVNLAL